jgi:hypothetical protein
VVLAGAALTLAWRPSDSLVAALVCVMLLDAVVLPFALDSWQLEFAVPLVGTVLVVGASLIGMARTGRWSHVLAFLRALLILLGLGLLLYLAGRWRLEAALMVLIGLGTVTVLAAQSARRGGDHWWWPHDVVTLAIGVAAVTLAIMGLLTLAGGPSVGEAILAGLALSLCLAGIVLGCRAGARWFVGLAAVAMAAVGGALVVAGIALALSFLITTQAVTVRAPSGGWNVRVTSRVFLDEHLRIVAYRDHLGLVRQQRTIFDDEVGTRPRVIWLNATTVEIGRQRLDVLHDSAIRAVGD